MDFNYPKMLYRFPATGKSSMTLEGSAFDTATVESADDEASAAAEGWCTTWPVARAAYDEAQAAKAAAEAAAAATALPTRAELEQKATELAIKFDGRTSDKKLSDQIAAALEP